MSRILDSMRGYVTVEIEGRHTERFLNLCSRTDTEFWDLKSLGDGTCRGKMYLSGYKKLMKKSPQRTGITLRRVGSHGTLKAAMSMKGRIALASAVVLCCVALWAASGHVWRIEIEGNETVTDTEILRLLETAGVKIGAKSGEIDSYAVRNLILGQTDELIWLSVNVSGSTARVKTAERRNKPDIENVITPTEVVAAKDGLITEITVRSGDGKTKRGQTAAKGDVLISPVLTTPREESYLVHADGDVYARTWYTLRGKMPLSCTRKEYTGNKKSKRTLIFGKQGINLYLNGGIPFDSCDKITKIEQWDIFGIMALPISVMTETYEQYLPIEGTVDTETAKEILKESLLRELEAQLDSGEVKSTDVEYSGRDGVLTAVLRAECVEQIGVKREVGKDEEIGTDPQL